MKRSLHSIPVVVDVSEKTIESEAARLAVLHELESMLETLIKTGETSEIDLRHAPLNTKDIASLKGCLGEGEVSARVDCLGTTSIQETSVSGVWWVIHESEDGRVLAESLEVTVCPEMLKTSSGDLRSGLGLLKLRLSQNTLDSSSGRTVEKLEALGFCASGPGGKLPGSNSAEKRGNGNAK